MAYRICAASWRNAWLGAIKKLCRLFKCQIGEIFEIKD
ncbi:helix-turn-helix domain-containing protein [Georgfuchsia toluolica]